MTPLDEQTVLVTGATGELGRALVRRFADHGTHVVAHGRSTARLGELVIEVESATGQHIDTLQADLAELRDVDRLADEVIARYDALHVLVNNAGVGFGAPGAPPRGERRRDRAPVRRQPPRRVPPRDTAESVAAVERAGAHRPGRLGRSARPGPRGPAHAHGVRRGDGLPPFQLAQVMATYDLAADLVGTGVTVTALHPATFMDTAMVREHGVEPVSSVQEGLDATWRRVASEDLEGVSGVYFKGQQAGRPHGPAGRRPLRRAPGGWSSPRR